MSALVVGGRRFPLTRAPLPRLLGEARSAWNDLSVMSDGDLAAVDSATLRMMRAVQTLAMSVIRPVDMKALEDLLTSDSALTLDISSYFIPDCEGDVP